MKMKSDMLALALTLLVSCGVGALLWWDAQRTAPPKQSPALDGNAPEARPLSEPLTRDSASAAPSGPALPANRLYRCQGAKGVLYQAEPCPSGTKQAAVTGGTMSVVSPPPARTIQYSPPPPPRYEGGAVGLIARTPAKPSGNESACKQHEQSIKQIDAAGRAGGSSDTMERLRERRRYHKDAMWRLGCGR